MLTEEKLEERLKWSYKKGAERTKVSAGKQILNSLTLSVSQVQMCFICISRTDAAICQLIRKRPVGNVFPLEDTHGSFAPRLQKEASDRSMVILEAFCLRGCCSRLHCTSAATPYLLAYNCICLPPYRFVSFSFFPFLLSCGLPFAALPISSFHSF